MSTIPKIIENIRESLIAEARRQVTESGYASATVRSITQATGVAIGTFYNYFKTKEDLFAAFVLEDWNECLAQIRFHTTYPSSPRDVLRNVFNGLKSFFKAHTGMFNGKEAYEAYIHCTISYHIMLRDQVAAVISEGIPALSENNDVVTAQFLAESVLTWVTADVTFDNIYSVLKKIIQD